MDEKLLKEGIGIEEIAEKINKIAKKELPIEDLKDNTNSMEKWTSIPCLLVLSDEDKDRFMSYVEYLDSSDLSIKEKALIITSLAGLMEHKKLKLSDYDNGSLYLISIFYKDKSFEEIDKTINVLGRQEILYAIRKKSLDMEERKKIISVVEKSIINDKIDSTDLNSVEEYITNKVKEIEETKY